MDYWTIFWVHTIVLVAKGALGQTEGDVRLVDGSSSLEGRIEVYYDGQWGTICSFNQDWGTTDSDVVCRQLGFQVSLGSPSFGPGISTQPIWLTNVQCEATDRRIDECITNNQWGQTNTCAHADDVGVRCSGLNVAIAPNYQGCYRFEDSPVSQTAFSHPLNTIEDCLEDCSNFNWMFAGLHGATCTCDGQINPSAQPVNDIMCRMPCPGNSAQLCGDDTVNLEFVSIYAVSVGDGYVSSPWFPGNYVLSRTDTSQPSTHISTADVAPSSGTLLLQVLALDLAPTDTLTVEAGGTTTTITAPGEVMLTGLPSTAKMTATLIRAANSAGASGFLIDMKIHELSNPRYNYNEDATQLTIAWDEFDVRAVTTNCTAFYSVTGSNKIQEMIFTNPNKEATITDLTPFTTYSVSLICQNDDGLSARLMYADETTFQGAPEAPRNVAVSEIEQSNALVTWDEPAVTNGILVGYIIQAIPQDCRGPCQSFIGDVPVSSRQLQLTFLSPGVDYSATVQAFNEEDRLQGPFRRRFGDPETKTFTTAPALPGPPNNVVSEDNTQTCTVFWDEPLEPNGVIVSYRVTMNTYRLGDDTVIETLHRAGLPSDSLSSQFLKSELPDYSDFSFNVAATNQAGRGTVSGSVTCRKQQVGVPVKPTSPNSVSDGVTYYSFDITLPDYQNPNGPISCFEVVVVQFYDASTSIDSDDNAYSINNTMDYSIAKSRIRTPFRAMVFSSVPAGNVITVGSTDEVLSTCNILGDHDRGRRDTVRAATLDATNGPLNEDSFYSCFIRVYSPSHDEVYFANGAFMEPIRLAEVPNSGANRTVTIVCVAVILLVSITVGISIYLWRRKRSRREEDGGVSATSAGVTMSYSGCDDHLQDNPTTSPGSPQAIHDYEMVESKSHPVYQNVEDRYDSVIHKSYQKESP